MPRPADTSPEVRAMQIEAFRKMTPQRRIQMAIEMSELVQQIRKSQVDRTASTPNA